MTACPCCASETEAVSPDVLAQTLNLEPIDVAILHAVWNGRGLPVMTAKIFDAMFEDDPDGGPSPSRMYARFHDGMERLTARLSGSGVYIDKAGYREGYRLRISTSA